MGAEKRFWQLLTSTSSEQCTHIPPNSEQINKDKDYKKGFLFSFPLPSSFFLSSPPLSPPPPLSIFARLTAQSPHLWIVVPRSFHNAKRCTRPPLQSTLVMRPLSCRGGTWLPPSVISSMGARGKGVSVGSKWFSSLSERRSSCVCQVQR